MAPRESQKRASLKWDKENMSVLSCKIRKEQADAFKAYCEGQGSKSNTVLKDFVLDCIGKWDGAGRSQEAAGSPVVAPTEAGVALSPATLNATQEAARSVGETVSQFIERAVETQIKQDKLARKKGW